MEFVRREIRLGREFDAKRFAAALASFRAQYSLPPERGVCSPDVFARAAELFVGASAAHRHSTRIAYEGVPIVVGILPPGTIVFEGSVDETKMGDW